MPDVERVRADFPILGQDTPNGRLVYLDNACTTLKPQAVIDAVTEYYRDAPVCGSRSIHHLGEAVSTRVEVARRRTVGFLGANGRDEIVFTKNATEGINLIAHSLGLRRGDVVVTTDKEHNSNWVPWLHLRDEAGIELRTLPSLEDGTLDPDQIEPVLRSAGDRLRLVSVVHASNADGVVNPVARLAEAAHEHGARILVDGSQSVPHHPMDVRALRADFLVASCHKMLGPTGLGFLYIAEGAGDDLKPFMLGGGTVTKSTADAFDWHDGPQRFEAGLQNFSALWAWPAALDYLDRLGRDWIESRERDLNNYASKLLAEMRGITIYGPESGLRSGIIPFNVEGLDAHDVALFLDQRRNVSIRSGAHCVNPYFERRGLQGWARASFYLYNQRADVDAFVGALSELTKGLRTPSPKLSV